MCMAHSCLQRTVHYKHHMVLPDLSAPLNYTLTFLECCLLHIDAQVGNVMLTPGATTTTASAHLATLREALDVNLVTSFNVLHAAAKVCMASALLKFDFHLGSMSLCMVTVCTSTGHHPTWWLLCHRTTPLPGVAAAISETACGSCPCGSCVSSSQDGMHGYAVTCVPYRHDLFYIDYMPLTLQVTMRSC